MGLCILSVLFNVHFLLFFTQVSSYSPNSCYLDNQWCQCESKKSIYWHFWRYIWPIIHLSVFAFIPLIIIFVCLIRIIRYTHRIHQNINDVEQNSTSLNVSHHHHQFLLVRTLIFLDILFPLTIFPTLFLHIYVHYVPPETCRTIGILNIIFSIGYASTFIKNVFAFGIYYLSGTKFRLAVKILFQRITTTSFPSIAAITSNQHFYLH
ncbi:unnamed protein product [Adineta steineri]|uniref:G-protein coupled receptors family 1 profile domain-containing protein n=1 Tax=Adineta steineri TaxID=433720 RepID=A0A814E081_9BILA|nr:unnamed protein product [Adineta steineri]CAF0962489.1 unnamed protein product [Adineta steineri]